MYCTVRPELVIRSYEPNFHKITRTQVLKRSESLVLKSQCACLKQLYDHYLFKLLEFLSDFEETKYIDGASVEEGRTWLSHHSLYVSFGLGFSIIFFSNSGMNLIRLKLCSTCSLISENWAFAPLFFRQPEL